MRLDVYLKEKGYVESRTRALNLINIGAVSVDGVIITKPSFDVKDGQTIKVVDKIKYCSLGGLKLEKAIEHFNLRINGTAIDIGASNGGFTDCLLTYGAKKIYAIDVGENALPDRLSKDSRVVVMDKTNARALKAEDFSEKADIITVDVSFISLTLILPVAATLIKDEGQIIALIKPQFELEKSALTKKGIVKNAKLRERALNKVIDAAKKCNLKCSGYTEVPELFDDKNIEYLVLFSKKLDKTNQ